VRLNFVLYLSILSIVLVFFTPTAYASLYITDFYGETQNCFETGDNLVISGVGYPERIEILNESGNIINWYHVIHDKNNNFYTIPFNVEDVTKRKLGTFTVESSVGIDTFYYKNHCPQKIIQIENFSQNFDNVNLESSLLVNTLNSHYRQYSDINVHVTIQEYTANNLIHIKLFKDRTLVMHETESSSKDHNTFSTLFSINPSNQKNTLLSNGNYLIIVEYNDHKHSQSFYINETIPESTKNIPFDENTDVNPVPMMPELNILVILLIVILGVILGTIAIIKSKKQSQNNVQTTSNQSKQSIGKKSSNSGNDVKNSAPIQTKNSDEIDRLEELISKYKQEFDTKLKLLNNEKIELEEIIKTRKILIKRLKSDGTTKMIKIKADPQRILEAKSKLENVITNMNDITKTMNSQKGYTETLQQIEKLKQESESELKEQMAINEIIKQEISKKQVEKELKEKESLDQKIWICSHCRPPQKFTSRSEYVAHHYTHS